MICRLLPTEQEGKGLCRGGTREPVAREPLKKPPHIGIGLDFEHKVLETRACRRRIESHVAALADEQVW